MKRRDLFVVVGVAVATSLGTMAAAPILADVPPFDNLIFFSRWGHGGHSYHNTSMRGMPVRIDNATGEAEMLTPSGWRRMAPVSPWPPNAP